MDLDHAVDVGIVFIGAKRIYLTTVLRNEVIIVRYEQKDGACLTASSARSRPHACDAGSEEDGSNRGGQQKGPTEARPKRNPNIKRTVSAKPSDKTRRSTVIATLTCP